MGRVAFWLVLVLGLLLANIAAWWWRERGGASPPPAAVTSQADARQEPLGDRADSPSAAVATLRPPGDPGAPRAGAPPSAASPLLMPVQGIDVATVADTFQDERDGGGRVHEAIDIMAPAGTPVLAVADGTIEKLFTSDRGGLTIYQFEPTGTFSYYYAHLQAYAPGLAEGMQVRRGQQLGTVGSSGNADPAAPHLHFAVFRLTPEREWWTGEPVNPWPLLQGGR
ncbi:M23 family metallopeptidase [Luteimonas deserti]|uniref:Peptidoglycan DD-metalloendopeptidase family protein n=1 Tax=Luteimonas deserti TaxID=2752306 RepID=A0A7Z0U0Q5_9GAMM|nr:M23 family metallopeptidase [Luteimonas deserti]NYZ63518.1 peptidoglycan DD-metalloendopeptidase family protein [Luteimonas deserti]